MRLNPPIISIRVTKEDCSILLRYCNKCNTEAFQNSNDFRRTEPIREALLLHGLLSVSEKLMDKLYKHHQDPDNKLIKIKFSHAERITFSAMFRRVEVPDCLQSLERDILNQLTTSTK